MFEAACHGAEEEFPKRDAGGEDKEHVGNGIGISAPYGDMASKGRCLGSEERLSLGCR